MSSPGAYIVSLTLWRYRFFQRPYPVAHPYNLGIGSQLQIPDTSIQAQNLYWLERVIHVEADGESVA